MKSTAHATGRHPEDGMLLRFLDDECEPDERECVATHVGACKTCHARLDAFRSLSAGISLRLAGDPPVRQAVTPRFPILRAAVVVLLIGAAVATAQPIGRWIMRLTGHTAAVSPGVTSAPVVRDAPGASAGHAGVWFVPSGPALEIAFRAAQRSGSLTLAPSADSSVGFGVSDGSVAPGVTVLPSGLVIANAATATASYRITVPSDVRVVSIRIGDRTAEHITWDRAARPRIVALTAASR